MTGRAFARGDCEWELAKITQGCWWQDGKQQAAAEMYNSHTSTLDMKKNPPAPCSAAALPAACHVLCHNRHLHGQGMQRPQACQTQGIQPPVWTFCLTQRLEPGLSASAPTDWSAAEDELAILCPGCRCVVRFNLEKLTLN